MTIKKGTVIPVEKGSYRVTRDIEPGDVLTVSIFEPLDGAPKLNAGDRMSPMMVEFFKSRSRNGEA